MPYEDPFDLQRAGQRYTTPPLGAMPYENLFNPAIRNLVSMQTQTPASQFVPGTFASPSSQLTPENLLAARTRGLFQDPLSRYWRMFQYPGQVFSSTQPTTTEEMIPWATRAAGQMAGSQLKQALPKKIEDVRRGPQDVLYASRAPEMDRSMNNWLTDAFLSR